MGCEIPISKGVPAPDLRALRCEAQILRGDFLDAFARLEEAVMQYVVRLKLNAKPGAAFSQKLKLLADAREHFVHPKRLDERMEAIDPLKAARADIVHSVINIVVQYDGADAQMLYLRFQNACHEKNPPLILSLLEFKGMTSKINTLASQFSHQQLKATTPDAPASASA